MSRQSLTHHLDETDLTMSTELFPGKQVKIDLASFIVGGSWESPNYAWSYKTIEYLYDKTKDIENAVMVDVGANTGSYSLIPKFNTNIKKIICIEPNIYILFILKRNLFLNGLLDKTEIYRIAASDYEGEEVFHATLGSSGQGTIIPIKKREPHAIQLKVKLMPLDHLINGPVNILKIDAQGSDLAVLRGAMNIITSHKPDILIEYTQINKQQIFDLLLPLGYLYDYVGDEDLFFTTRGTL